MSAQNLAVANRNDKPWVRAKDAVDALQLTEQERDYLIAHFCLYAGHQVNQALTMIKHDRAMARVQEMKAAALAAADVASGSPVAAGPPSVLSVPGPAGS